MDGSDLLFNIGHQKSPGTHFFNTHNPWPGLNKMTPSKISWTESRKMHQMGHIHNETLCFVLDPLWSTWSRSTVKSNGSVGGEGCGGHRVEKQCRSEDPRFRIGEDYWGTYPKLWMLVHMHGLQYMKGLDNGIFFSICNLGEVSIQDWVTNCPQLHNKIRDLGWLSQGPNLWNWCLSCAKFERRMNGPVCHCQDQLLQLIVLLPQTFLSLLNCPNPGCMDTRCLSLCCHVQHW